MHQEIISTIKQRREHLGLTQESLSELAGIGLRTLKNIELGESSPTLRTLEKIFDVLGMELKVTVKTPIN